MSVQTYTSDTEGVRIDKWLSDVSGLSRTRVQDLCSKGLVSVNEKAVRSSYKIETGDVISMDVPEDEPLQVEAEDIPLDILYEDSDIIVVNKPKGMVVHPAAGVTHGTLVNALLYHCKDLSGINGVLRPGIVHRIDKDTTGCIVACKNDNAHRAIARQLEDKTCHREYKAVCTGVIPHDSGLIDGPIGRDPRDRQRMCVIEGGKPARTHFQVIERFKDSTYIDCALETGRTHQIRAHMKYIGHPLLGDEKYGGNCSYMDTQGQVLHAYQLTLVHPSTGKEMTFEAPLPDYFSTLLKLLRSGK
ncbi:MAG: RluA family pseudouridine synthase [Bulleidia sp.]|nr:RluA family pseudouridine synthase [Bulleidia sp.]